MVEGSERRDFTERMRYELIDLQPSREVTKNFNLYRLRIRTVPAQSRAYTLGLGNSWPERRVSGCVSVFEKRPRAATTRLYDRLGIAA